MKNNHVLMIDDDESLVGIMAIKLQHMGYRVDTALRGSQGYAMASKQPYDIVILDVTMPDLSGYEVCKNLRDQGVLTPILMLSGQTEKSSIVKSLEFGADDYLTKPFSQNELVARLRALVRRERKTFSAREIHKCGLRLDTSNNTAYFDDKSIILTGKESMLLKRLMFDSPEPIPRDKLLKDVWAIDDLHTSNRLDVYVRRLRFKLESIGASDLIHTQRGSGYYFADCDDK